MSSITLEVAQTQLADLIDRLAPGEEVTLTRNDKPVATLKAAPPPGRKPRVPGSAKGILTVLAEDDDRLIAAQSLVEGIPVFSADPGLDAYGVTRIW